MTTAGCGSARHQHATTITEKQANREDACIGLLTNSTSPSCTAAVQAINQEINSNSPEVIKCTAGGTTNGSCVFLAHVQAAVKALHLTGSKVSVTVTNNPVRCVRSNDHWYCHSQRSAVWVRFPA